MNLRLRLSGVLPVLAGAFLALSVFGCGGGDGGSEAPAPAPAAPEEPAAPAPAEPSPAATTRNEIIRAAAENRPVAGSVSQGSRRGQNQQGIVTPDRVTWNGNGGNGIRITVGSTVAQPDPLDDSSNILEGVNSPDGVLDLVTDPDSGATGAAIVQVVSDVRYTATSGEFTPVFSANRNNPNLVFGVYATANADNEITAIGAFADGTETPSAAIPTSGTYTGNLFAFYQNFDSDDDIEEAAYSVASVELTVATNGSVSGRVFNIADKDSPDSDSFTFINADAGGAIVVTMASATPSSSQDGGFFNATTTLSRGGQTVSEGVDESEGRWGGQFFGTTGQQIAGTVGLNIEYSDGSSGTVFGSFSATRN